MTITEVEERTGLTRSNIRFYEKEGLLTPARDKNSGYRNYSEEDVETIRKIAFLRTLEIPVEEIGRMISGQQPLRQTVERQREILLKKLQADQASVRACEKLLDADPVTFEELRVEQYTAETDDYWEKRRTTLRQDSPCVLRPLGSFTAWKVLAALCLAGSLVSWPVLPSEIPLQWSQGVAVSFGNRYLIFLYPVLCMVWRVVLLPCLYGRLRDRLHGRLISEYLANGLCFVCFTVELFTVFYACGLVRTGIFPVLAADAALIFGVLVFGVWELLNGR